MSPGKTNTSKGEGFCRGNITRRRILGRRGNEAPDCSSMIPAMSVTVSTFTSQRA
jgi:hypothetical protein